MFTYLQKCINVDLGNKEHIKEQNPDSQFADLHTAASIGLSSVH